MPITIIIPETLRTFRLARGLTLEELADQSGVGIATIKRIEKSDTPYRAKGVGPTKLADALNIPISYLSLRYHSDVASVAEGDFVEIRYIFFRHEVVNGETTRKYVGTNVKHDDWDEVVVVPEHVPKDPIRGPGGDGLREKWDVQKKRSTPSK